MLVRFRLEVPEARSVRLAGSFTNWEARFELHEDAPGIWTGILPVPPGIHEYAFLVDGARWLADPAAPTGHEAGVMEAGTRVAGADGD